MSDRDPILPLMSTLTLKYKSAAKILCMCLCLYLPCWRPALLLGTSAWSW